MLGNNISSLNELENIIPFNEIGLMPRRDIIAFFSWYNVLIADKYDFSGEIAPFKAILSYLNQNDSQFDANWNN